MATVATDVETAAVAAALRNYIEAVEAHDLGKYSKLVAHDEDLAWYGSAPGQIVGWGEVEATMREMFEGLSEIKIDQSDLRVHFSPDRQLAWATCLWDFRATAGDQPVVEPVRCTWVLERRLQEWMIVHWHKSVGVPG
jgi:ketosteroid isomerase-like protein